MASTPSADVLVAGGGLAGIVTALEALRAGLSVTLVDRDTEDRFGGLARWAFGGMALVGTPLQARMKIPDTPEIALRDWLRFGEVDPVDHWSLEWARHYVERSRPEVYDWLVGEGLRFLPAVNWVERGRYGEGNSLPRYHIVWGTARELVLRLGRAMRGAGAGGRLTVLHRHRITGLEREAGRVGADALPRLHLALVALLGDLRVEGGQGERMHHIGREGGVVVDRGRGVVLLPVGFGAFAEAGDEPHAGDPGFARGVSHRS